MTIAENLAEYVYETKSVPEDVQLSGVKCIFDLITAAIAGYQTPNAIAVRRIASKTWGSGPATIWYSGERSTPVGAAFVNSACACALDLDDGHRAAAGHPGTAIIPGVFAAVEKASLDTQRILTAVALGYEVGVRISASRDLKTIPTTNTGLWCGQAVAAAVGALSGSTPLQIAHAIAIAGMVSPSQSATPYTRFRGNNVKEGIPWGTANGVLAVSLAREGFTGPIDILDNAERYNPGPLLDGLGSSWHINNTYFKPYSCCRWIHAPIDALLALMAENDFGASDITAIEVETFGRTLTLGNDAVPATLEAAQYSLPFCMGVAAVRGAPALLPLTTKSLSDTHALDVSRRVTMTVAPDLDAMFPTAVPGRIRVITGGATFERSMMRPKGEPANPMTWDDLDAKFLAIADGRIGAVAMEQIRSAIQALRMGDIAPLCVGLDSKLFEPLGPLQRRLDDGVEALPS